MSIGLRSYEKELIALFLQEGENHLRSFLFDVKKKSTLLEMAVSIYGHGIRT